jgi:hypothetical protein
MASCDTTVLTGQEGLIQFKPLGSTNCVDDFCPFAGDRIYVGCAADYDIGDCLNVDVDNIPNGEGQSTDGTADNVIKEGDTLWVIDTGKGIAGDEDACGNDMEGVPYIIVSATEGGSAITWDGSLAGEELESGLLIIGSVLDVNLTGGSGYNDGVHTGIALSGGSGSGAEATVTVTGNAVTSVVVTKSGSGYAATDTGLSPVPGGTLTFTPGTAATFDLDTGDITSVRGNSDRGRYTFRLCEFQTVCGVRSFSIDLSRDELDVTTLPCSVSQTCGAELASFRKTQAGFATATGSLEVYFSCDQTSTANKLLTGSLQRTQGSATVRLYVCTKTNADGSINETDSLFIEADIQLLGLSFSVNPDDPTTATINFGVTEVRSAFGLQGT